MNVLTALANYRGQDVHLLTPAKVHFADGLAFDSIKLGADQDELDVQGQISPALNVHASLRGVQAPQVNAFYPGLLAAGTIEAHADLNGSLASPSGEVSLNA